MSPLILLRHAEVYAPERLGRRDLLAAGGELVALAPSLPDLPRGIEAEVVDLEGRRVIPGLIDGHVHLTGGGGEAEIDTPRAISAIAAILIAFMTFPSLREPTPRWADPS